MRRPRPELGLEANREWRSMAEQQRDAELAALRAWHLGLYVHAPPDDVARMHALSSEHHRHLLWLQRTVLAPVMLVGEPGPKLVLARARVLFAGRRGWRAVRSSMAEAERSLAVFIAQSRLIAELPDNDLRTAVMAMLGTSNVAVGWLAG